MKETGEGILSNDTDSFKTVIDAGSIRVSHTGDAAARIDMMKAASIADAKFCIIRRRL